MFAEKAALRHVPICSSIISKPKTLEEKKRKHITSDCIIDHGLVNNTLNMSRTKGFGNNPSHSAYNDRPKTLSSAKVNQSFERYHYCMLINISTVGKAMTAIQSL